MLVTHLAFSCHCTSREGAEDPAKVDHIRERGAELSKKKALSHANSSLGVSAEIGGAMRHSDRTLGM